MTERDAEGRFLDLRITRVLKYMLYIQSHVLAY